MDLTEIAIALHRQIASSSITWSQAYTLQAAPASRAAITSLLAHAIGVDDARFVHAVIEEPDHASTHVQVTVFTDEALAVVTGVLSPSAVVLPRTALKAIKITSSPNVVNGSGWDAAAPLRLELDYSPLLEGALILGHKDQTPRNATDLAGFLDELRRDLTR